MTILLVEDHEETGEFLSRRLKRRGFDVVVATDGQDGVEEARSESPDPVRLDVNLPTVDGWTAARTMRADPATATMPIIALTAHAMSGDKEKAIAAGCTDHCPKPIDVSDRLSKIDRYTPKT